MKNIIKILVLPIVCIFIQCKDETVYSSIDGFDISNDDSKVIFACLKGNHSSVYSLSLKNKQINLLIGATDTNSYYSPAYSTKGDQIIFIKSNLKELLKSSICVSDTNGKNIKCLLETQGIITEIFFSNNDNDIIFCKANEYSKYSPLGVKVFHNFDLYGFNLISKKVTRITNLKAYSLSRISEIDSTRLIFSLVANSEYGMYVFNKEKKNLTLITPVNNPRKDTTLYNCLAYSRLYNIYAFAAPYEIYYMKSLESNAVFVERAKANIHYLKFFNNQKAVLFTEENYINFFMLDVTTKQSKEIPLSL